jgi:hypothetical protein
VSEAYYRCSRCGLTGICNRSISGEIHRIYEHVHPDEPGLLDDQRMLARSGKLARVFLCGTWTKLDLSEPEPAQRQWWCYGCGKELIGEILKTAEVSGGFCSEECEKRHYAMPSEA